MNKNDVIAAHRYCVSNREQLLQDRVCGCFYCLKIFDPKRICEWIEEGSGTALCPFCEVDSVIGESSGFPITTEFLQAMNEYWF